MSVSMRTKMDNSQSSHETFLQILCAFDLPDGNRCCDVMELSGEDGSLVIRKANPDAGKFVLPAAG